MRLTTLRSDTAGFGNATKSTSCPSWNSSHQSRSVNARKSDGSTLTGRSASSSSTKGLRVQTKRRICLCTTPRKCFRRPSTEFQLRTSLSGGGCWNELRKECSRACHCARIAWSPPPPTAAVASPGGCWGMASMGPARVGAAIVHAAGGAQPTASASSADMAYHRRYIRSRSTQSDRCRHPKIPSSSLRRQGGQNSGRTFAESCFHLRRHTGLMQTWNFGTKPAGSKM
mmetsp:Transcript_112226/g.317186  ORF Transcript_112226/g.317186 Transcript_112226/m.317186 type:complete len:228 (-) Transcript_112226:555-1238(-)